MRLQVAESPGAKIGRHWVRLLHPDPIFPKGVRDGRLEGVPQMGDCIRGAWHQFVWHLFAFRRKSFFTACRLPIRPDR